MKLSIIIPIYNSFKFLDECINSIKICDSIDYELICIDDGSTDKSLELLKSFESNIDNFTIITQSNKGQSNARNNALKMARGEYIFFLDSDDSLIYKSLEFVITKIIDEDIICFNAISCDSDMYFNLYYKELQFYNNIIYDGLSVLELSASNIPLVPWCYVFKRDFLIKNDLFFKEGFFHEDALFVLQTFFYAKKISFIPYFPVVKYRIHNNSTTNNRKFKTIYDLIIINREIFNFFINMNFLKDEIKKVVWNLYMYSIRKSITQNYQKEFDNIITTEDFDIMNLCKPTDYPKALLLSLKKSIFKYQQKDKRLNRASMIKNLIKQYLIK
ncbi:MAG: glycosyltransferase [Bacteroidales bacterium]|nr:glycosyltransferase [Bacteroidales bacterium]